MRLSVCIGQYAQTPYCVPGVDINVYSMEELCYCICENAFLIDTGIMNDELLSWIDRECGLRIFAKALFPYVHKKGVLSTFVAAIFEYVGLYEKEEIDRVEKVLRQGAGLNPYERRKNQVDFLVKKKKYYHAIKEYDALIEQWSRAEQEGEVMPPAKCLASIYHNKGVAMAGLMIYKVAADCFFLAYELDRRGEYFRDYLAAKRMQLSEQEYISFVAELPDSMQTTLVLEKEMEQYREEWRQQADYNCLLSRRALRESVNKKQYYDENDVVVQNLKSYYRNILAE